MSLVDRGMTVVIQSTPIKVLVVDPSAALRTRVTRAFGALQDFQVPVSAHDTNSAREQIRTHQPDVILVALDMPRQDAVPFIEQLRENYPVPVFVIAPPGQRAGRQAQSAFAIGALEAFMRPSELDRETIKRFVDQMAGSIRIAVRRARPVRQKTVQNQAASFSWSGLGIVPRRHVIAIGASTGGTEATLALLMAMPPGAPPMLIAQHMPAGFTKSYAQRLDRLTPHHVREADREQPLLPGEVLVAPGDYHLKVYAKGTRLVARTSQSEPVNLHRPSVDALFDSVADVVGSQAIGFILSGMGADGAAGLLRMRQAGALTFGQSKESSVVYGMPQAAARLDAVITEAAPQDLPQRMATAWREQHANAAS